MTKSITKFFNVTRLKKVNFKFTVQFMTDSHRRHTLFPADKSSHVGVHPVKVG